MSEQESILDKLSDITKTIAEGDIGSDENFTVLSKSLSGALADVAHSIEDIRKSLIDDVTPNLTEGSDENPSAFGHLGDINKTLSDAADRLFELTEKGITDNDRSSELIAKLGGLVDGGNGDAKGVVEELAKINSQSKSELMEFFTALSFQDLAGQKIMKVNDLINEVETKILQILVVLGYTNPDKTEKQDEMLSALKETSGPIEQTMVDDILKEFGL